MITADLEWQQLALYAVGAAVLLIVLFRLPYIGGVIRSLFSLALLAFFIFLLFRHAPFDPNLSRMSQSLGLDTQQVSGDEIRIPMSSDGHFWAQAEINGVERRMLVDSGATMTALSQETAQAASIEADAGLLPVVVRTAAGTIPAETGSIPSLRIGSIEAENLKTIITPSLGNFDILGMNFLSQLASWRVEGRTLILVPQSAQAS